MKKVLILSASYGEGHNAAARGLAMSLAQIGGEAEIFDPFPESFGSWYDRSRHDYLAMIERTPRVWGLVYTLLDRTPIVPLSLPILGSLRTALSHKIEELQPAIIVSTYPLYSFLLNELYPSAAERAFQLYTVVTDSITINSVWHRSPSDLWFMPNEASADVMCHAGVPPEKLRVSGFPVPPVFANERPERTPPGNGAPLRVIYMINADKPSAPGLVARLLELENIELTVTAGRDEELFKKIQDTVRESGRSAEVLGWTNQMPQFLMRNHLLIGKAGGAAVQEAIAARTPMLITKVVPGQEEGNAQLLLQNECAAVCDTPELMVESVQSLTANNARLWREWESNIARISRPDAGLRIAAEIMAAARALEDLRAVTAPAESVPAT